MTEFDNMQALDEGWGVFDCEGSANGPWQIQKCDDLDVFKTDMDAWSHVFRKAFKGSRYHAAALNFIHDNNLKEYAAILAHVADNMEELTQ